jgi:hypothetical protein
MAWKRGLDLNGSGQGPVVNSFKQGKASLGSSGKLIDKLGDCDYILIFYFLNMKSVYKRFQIAASIPQI